MKIPAIGWGLRSVPVVDTDEPGRRSPRDWVADTLCFLLAVGFTVIIYFEGRDQRLDPVLLAVDVTLGGLSCLGMWLRRRWPVGFAVTTIVFSAGSMAATVVGLIALFTVAVHRPFAVVARVMVVFLLASTVSVFVRPDMAVRSWSQAALGVACVAAVLAWAMFVRARRQLAQSLREQAVRAESDRFAQARLQERQRIAREMHDVLAHRISLLSLHAGALELRAAGQSEEIAGAAGVIRDSAHQALEDLREVIGVLRADQSADAPEPPQPTLADVPELAEESRRAGMRVRLDCQVADPTDVPVVAGRNAYRIVQEGLTNARKHAQGAEVSVTVHGTRGDGLTVEIRNPCAVATAIPGAGSGIIGLTERAHLAGGRLEHGRTTTGDFRLWAWLPW